MALEKGFTEAVIKGLVGLGVSVFRGIPGMKINKRFAQLWFNFKKKYVQTYTERHGQVQILGMSKPIPLDRIYSGARMLDTGAMKSYASQTDLTVTYQNSGERRFGHYDCPKRNGSEIAKENARLIVLGDPGIGKSTFLRKIGLEALLGNLGDYPYIPVFLELKRFRTAEVDLIASIASEFENCGFPRPEGFTKNALKKGQLLLLFDGLDEVPADNLDTVIESIQALVDRYSENRFIASCRIAAYHTYFKRVNTVAIAEFDDIQIEKFIDNWFSSEQEQEQENQIAKKCWEQLQLPENRGAKELAQAPLLLTFLCMVYNESQTIPSDRTTLYGRALDILLKNWASEKRVVRGEIFEGFHADLEKKLLAKIAYEGFAKNQLFLAKDELKQQFTEFLCNTSDAPKNLNADAVLDAIVIQQGILVERAINIYSFSHLSLQEFLTAKYLINCHKEDEAIELHITNENWREVFLHLTALKRIKAKTLLNAMLEKAQKVAEHHKLSRLLAWAEQRSNIANDPAEQYNIRLVNMVLVNALALARDSNLAEELTSSLDRARALDYSLSLGVDRREEFANILDHASNRARLSLLCQNSKRNYVQNISLARTRDCDLARALKDLRETQQLGLEKLLDEFKGKVQDSEGKVQDFENLQEYISWSNEQWCNVIELDTEELKLDSEDFRAISNYFHILELMQACWSRTNEKSPQVWQELQNDLIRSPYST